jgi:hypothetical protein
LPTETHGMDFVRDWIPLILGIVPPFCLELVLIDGRRHFLHSVLLIDEETSSVVIRIWDLRALTDGDIEGLKRRLNEIGSRDMLVDATTVHPKLDWANLRARLDQISYCIEWHDRLWPEEQRPRIGFRADPPAGTS